MKREPPKKRSSECFAKSPEGLWIKAEVVESGIELSWQVRTKISNGRLCVLDANGDVKLAIPRERAIYPETMRSAGIIPVDDAFVEFSCLDRFERMLEAVMRHATYMIACGYGDSPQEVVGWFEKIAEAKFVNGTSYRFIEEHDPFVDLLGVECVVYEDEDEDGEVDLVVVADVRDKKFEFRIDSDKSLVSFILATIPI